MIDERTRLQAGSDSIRLEKSAWNFTPHAVFNALLLSARDASEALPTVTAGSLSVRVSALGMDYFERSASLIEEPFVVALVLQTARARVPVASTCSVG